MGYLYLMIVALLFSFGGTCVKFSKACFSPEYITWIRFVVGVLFLMIVQKSKKEKLIFHWKNKWVWIGGIGKALAYLMENYALTLGPSYGNIVIWPIQTILFACISIWILKESISLKKLLCMGLCVIGVGMISLNGRSLSTFWEDGFLIFLLFIGTAIGAVIHVFSQKMVAGKMDVINSNFSIFLVGAILSLIPLPITGTVTTPIIWSALFAAGAFGIVTGLGFWLNALALEKVAFYMVPIIQSTTVIFSITWGFLFFHEAISVWIIGGTGIFLAGLIFMNLKRNQQRHRVA